MKRIVLLPAVLLVIAAVYSCSKNDPVQTVEQVVSQEVKERIAALGFNPNDAYVHENGYIVENDIFLSKEDLEHNHALDHLLVVGEEEQYHTFNLVGNLPRVITVSASGNINTNISSAIDIAIARYNAANLQLTFQRVTSGGNIDITVVNGGSFIASAGFPTGGNPYPQVQFNRQYRNWNVNTLASVFAHEIGHCIGFRHTDYMNRAYSCGSGGNEGQETTGVGAVHIPGTPTGPDPNSWMLACIGNGINRPFNTNDVTALNYLY